MKVLVLGANGHLGQFVVNDLLEKGYGVVTLTKQPSTVKGTTNFVGNSEHLEDVQNAAKGCDAIISTLGSDTVEGLVKMSKIAAEVAVENDIPLIWSGGAGTLTDKDGKRLADTSPDSLPAGLRTAVFGHAKVLEYFPTVKHLQYVFVSPAINMELDRPESKFKVEISTKALYNEKGEPSIGYKTQAKVLTYLVENYKPFLDKQVTSVETK